MMRTYDKLNDKEQVQAREIALDHLVEAVVEGGFRFNDEMNHDNLQKRIDKAIDKAEKMQTPWFAAEYILETCRDELEGMASCDAEDSFYPDRHERAIYLHRRATSK